MSASDAPQFTSPLNGLQRTSPHGGSAPLRLVEVTLDIAEVTARRGHGAAVEPLLRGDVLRVAPETWLVRGALAAPGAQHAALRQLLADRASVVDQSSGLVTLRLSGEPVRGALSKLCRLDLHPSAFIARAAARTIMAQTPVVLYRPDDTTLFDLMVPTTLAHAFAIHLIEAAHEYGIEFATTAAGTETR